MENKRCKRGASLEERLNHYSVEVQSGCVEWSGRLNEKGYGRITIEGKTWRSHRLSWVVNKGKITDGLFVLHKCDNRKCVNPDHLFLGTHTDNMDDMMDKRQSQFS